MASVSLTARNSFNSGEMLQEDGPDGLSDIVSGQKVQGVSPNYYILILVLTVKRITADLTFSSQ